MNTGLVVSMRLLYALLVWVAASILVSLLGSLLLILDMPVATLIGNFLKTFSFLIGFLAAVGYYLQGRPPTRPV